MPQLPLHIPPLSSHQQRHHSKDTERYPQDTVDPSPGVVIHRFTPPLVSQRTASIIPHKT